jgi:hypothetical protein
MSTVAIKYNGTDITRDCMYARCSFEQQANAIPGTFELSVKDVNRTHSFTTGKEVTLEVDGVMVWAGFLM